MILMLWVELINGGTHQNNFDKSNKSNSSFYINPNIIFTLNACTMRMCIIFQC